MLSLISLHLSHDSSTFWHSFTQLRGLPHLSELSSPFYFERSLTAPICLTELLHILSGFPSSSNTTYQCINPGAKKSCSHRANVPANTLSWLVLPSVPSAQNASLHPAAQHFTQPPTTSPTLVSERRDPVGFSWHKHKVPLGSFLDPLHAAYREATKALPAA